MASENDEKISHFESNKCDDNDYEKNKAPVDTDKDGSNARDSDDGLIVGNIRITKSQSGSEGLYENVGTMELSVDIENTEKMDDCIFFDTVDTIEDDIKENLSYDKNSLLDSGINADELLCGTDIDRSTVEIGKVTIAMVDDLSAIEQDSKEDEEVEFIMKSSDLLDRLGNELRVHIHPDKGYEDVNTFRKRSRSNDESVSVPARFDFARYGISIGINSANDLLPGIEEFLSNVLAKETLSDYAEEQRLYFLERLDIIKLPPSIPPRPQSLGIRLYPLHSSPPPKDISVTPADVDDFAAYQRELSRALVDSETSPEPGEVKVYDDIDISDISFVHEQSTIQTEEESVYEIPQAKSRNLNDSGYERAKNRTLSDSGYEKAIDISPVSKAVSLEGLEVLHSSPQPPPLPPRRERAISDAASRSSIGSIIEEKILEFNKKNREDSMIGERTQDSKSERSSDDILDEGTDEMDGLSYDSMEDTGSLTQLSGVQLPKPTKKRRKSQRRRMVQSLTNMKEIAVPLRNLEDVLLTGELHYRSKLTWTKKIVALTNGRMICYKPDKIDNRPTFVILLTGYNPTFQKREGKRNFEINLTHENFESHMFLADFKEWAETWCEYIKYAAQGKKPPGPILNLTRASFDCQDGTYQLGKSPIASSGSNLSLASSDGFDTDPGTVKVKKRDSTGTKTARMGSFAFRATQFFESLSKKSSVKKSSGGASDKGRPLSGALSQSSLTEETVSPLTPESGIAVESPLEVQRHIKHQGYLDIYSNFNKRKWGKRWCMVHENSFECYRTQTSEVCELEFYLRNCVLRRAIEETKSELGLMLLENNREKITIEPMNWTELGSWLRVLMRETSTSEVPEGLAGYMDDTNPYHEAMEVTRLSMLSDPFPKSPTTPGVNSLSPDADAQKEDGRGRNLRNRDSGNCSSESMDGRFGSLERIRAGKAHASYTDSSLPRVTVPNSGDLYTQIRKHSETGSVKKSPHIDKSSQRSMSEGREPVNVSKLENQVFDFSFEGNELNVGADKETEGSLMDEIMSQFRSQIPSAFDSDTDTGEHDNMDNISVSGISVKTDTNSLSGTYEEKFVNLLEGKLNHINVSVVSDKESINADSDSLVVLNSQVVDDNTDRDITSKDVEVEVRRKLSVETPLKKTSSLLYGEKGMQEVIEELRTRLVQLKKDRLTGRIFNVKAHCLSPLAEYHWGYCRGDTISIRDRKQAVTSDVDREYLEAEFHRLNRECDKVSEEIKYLERLQKLENIVANKEANPINTAGAPISYGDENVGNLQPAEDELEITTGAMCGSSNKNVQNLESSADTLETSGTLETVRTRSGEESSNDRDQSDGNGENNSTKNLSDISSSVFDNNKTDAISALSNPEDLMDETNCTSSKTSKAPENDKVLPSNNDSVKQEDQHSQCFCQTVEESIVSNNDLVSKPNISNAEVIIVEPDSCVESTENGIHCELNRNKETCDIKDDAINLNEESSEQILSTPGERLDICNNPDTADKLDIIPTERKESHSSTDS